MRISRLVFRRTSYVATVVLVARVVIAQPANDATTQQTQLEKADVPQGPAVSLLSPRNYQVFQRRTLAEGPVVVSGHTRLPADGVEMLVSGSSLAGPLPDRWRPIPFDQSSGHFSIRRGWPVQLHKLRRTKNPADQRNGRVVRR